MPGGLSIFPLLALSPRSNWNLIPFLALYGAQEAGLGLNYYVNSAYLRTYRDMGGESSFLRTGAGTLYLADKTLTVASVGLVSYGAMRDESGPLIAGLVGYVFTNLLDFYVWHQLRQSNNEARSAIRNWNAEMGVRDGGLSGKLAYSFL